MNDLEKLYELIKSASPSFGLSIEAFAESMNDQSYVDSLRSWASESSQEIVDQIDVLSLKRGYPVNLLKKKDGTSQEEGTGFSWFQEDTSLESAGYVPPMESQESDESITIDDTPFSVEEVMTPEEVSDYRSEQYPLQKSGLITNRKYFESLGGDVDQMLTDIVNERISETKEEQTDEFKQKARDLWNEMSSFKTTWRTSRDIDNWDKGPSLVESYKNFEEFLSLMSQPVIEDPAYSLKVFDPYAFKDDLEKSRYMNMTYRLDLERERLESEKKEKDKKRNEILEEEKERLKTAAGEDPFRFTEEKFKRWLDEQETVGKAGANLIKRKNPRRREELWQKWRDTQEQMKEQLTPLDDKDQDFIDAYLSEITPSLIDKEEDEVVRLMNEKYGRFGFVFKESGALTDQMVVTSKKEGVSPLYVNLDPILESSEIFGAKQLRDYIKKNAIHSEAIVEDEDKMFTEKSLRAQSLRDKGGLDNDGVSMTSGEYDGKNVAYPTLFPKDPNNYTEDPGDWMELSGDDAYQEALKRGEVFYFDTPSEARNFAEGSWKYANLADVEAEKFFEERGLDYRSMHMAYEQYEDLMDRVKLIDDEGFLGRGGEIIKVSPDEIWMAEHQGLVTYESKDVGGRFKSTEGKQLYARIRNDIDDYYKTINEQADALYDDGFYTTAIREAREDWDVYSHQKMVERRKSGARLNGIAKGVLNEVNKESINLFQKPLDEVDASLLSGQQLADYNTLKEVQKQANVSKKFAAQEYLNADTYLDSKFDKKMTEHFKENFEGFMTQVKSGLRNGQAAEQILMISLGLTDASSREELMKAADEIVRFKTLSQSYGIQGVSERANKARNASEFWDTVFNDPFEYILGLAANSMAQMLPYGWWITGTATGAGAATGSAIPVLGTVAGAKAGFTIGMAATSFAMEYTNAVLEAGENQGYDMMNPQDVLLALEDKNVWEEGADIGTKRGVPIAVIDLISGGVAGKVFKVGSVASKGSRIAGQVAERAIFDPIMEGVGELSAQYVAGQDMEWKEIVAESLGGLGGNAPNMAVNMLAEFKQKSKIQLAENLIDIERMAKEKASDETISNWANRMHKTGQIDADMNQRIQENVGHRREAKSLLETDKFARVLGGKKTKEEARVMQLLQARDELSSTTNRKQVFKAKIKAINEELAIMAETKAMAPENSMVELALEEGKKPELSRYSIDGKQYTKKAFLDKVGAMSEDKRAKKKIQVLNDPETAKQVGLKTIELDAVQKQQTEEGMLRPKAEEPTDEVGLQEVGQVQPEEVQKEKVKAFRTEGLEFGAYTAHRGTGKYYSLDTPFTQGKKGEKVSEVELDIDRSKVLDITETQETGVENKDSKEYKSIVDEATKRKKPLNLEGAKTQEDINKRMSEDQRELFDLIRDVALERGYEGVISYIEPGAPSTDRMKEIGREYVDYTEGKKQQPPQFQIKDDIDVDPSVAIAPYFDTQVETIEDAKDLRQSESYQAYRAKIDEVAKDFGLEAEVQENIGGYKNESGNEIVEVSNTVVLKGATIEQAEEFAAIMAALTPDVQEASIAAQVVDEGSANHNANMYSVVVSDTQAAVNALKKAGITDYSINQSTNEVTFIDVLEFSDLQLQEKIGNFIKELKKENVSYEQKGYQAVDSRYVGKGDRQAILRRAKGSRPKKGKQGQRIHNALDQAISRDAYFQDLSVENYLTDGKKAGNRIFNVGIPAVKKIADRYYQRVFRKPRGVFEGTKEIQKDRAKEIAKAFEESKRTIDDPEVKAAYDKLVEETIEQYKEFIDAGYVVEVDNKEPYDNSQQMIDDLRDNKRIKIFSTESGFGDTEITEQQRKDNPLLQETEFVDVNGVPLLANDLFRAIHDFFGHAELGNGFGPIGEENAWNVHVRMFSPLAAKAMTTETRGQNSWVNFSGVNDEVFKKRDKARELRKRGKVDEAKRLVDEVYEEMTFAEQKVTLLPDEFSVPTDLKEEKLQPQLETGKREDVESVAAEKEMAMSEMEEAGVELAEDPFTVEQPAPDAEVVTITLDKDNPLTKDLERIGLKDLVGKKINLAMADRLKVDKKNMGGPFLPLIKALRGKIAWASIDNKAASAIVKGAIDADYTVVYNMASSGVDSNKAMGFQLIEKLDAISPQKKQEVFQLIKDHIKKLDNKDLNKIKGLVAKSTSLEQLVDSIYNPDKNPVNTRAAFTRAILPSQDVLEESDSTPIANEMRKLGLTIEELRDQASEKFARNIPTGSMTMVLEITDKKGNKVTEKTADEAIVSPDQQKEEGLPQHPNYDVYIRGRVVGLLKETTPFWNVIPEYLGDINKKVSGLIKALQKTKPLETLTPQELKVFEKLNAVFDAKNTKDKLEALSKVRLSKELDQDVREKLRSQIVAAKKLKNAKKIDEAVKEAVTPFAKKTKISPTSARSDVMRSAGMTAFKAREVSSPVASMYQKFVSVLSRSFPSVEIVSTQKEFDELIKDIYAKQLTTKDQKVYGAVYKGKLYLNPGLADYNTAVHEFGHVWLNVAKEANKSLYNKGLSLIKESPYVKKVESSESYKKVINQMRKDGVSESDIEAYVLEEALAMAIGDRGESFVVAARNKNFKNWLSTLYGYVRKLTGISKYTSEQIETISLDEFLDAVNVDLLSGKSLFEGYQVSNMGDQLQLQSDIRAKKIKGDPRSIIADAQQKGFTNEDIKSVLIAQGFDEVLVNSYLDVQLDLITEAPSSFDRVEGGAIKGLELFQDVKERLDKYANRKSEKTKKKPTPEMIRKRAMDLMMENSIWKAQPENIQAELLIAFDQLLGIEVNQTVDMQITNLKNMVTPPLNIKQVKKKFNKVLRGLGVPKQLKSGPQVKQLTTLINNLTDKNYDESIKKAVEIIDVMLDKQLTQQQRANQKLEKQKAESDRKLNDLKQKLDDYKKKAAAAVMNQKDIVYGKTMLSTLIKKTLPKGELTNTEVKRLLTRIERVKSQESFKTEADNTVKLIQKIRTRLKKNKIKEIASVVKEISKLKVTQSGKVRTKGRVDARTHEYFGNLLPVINTIMGVSPYKDNKLVKNKKGIQNSWDSMSDLKDYLSSEKTLELIDEIESKLINGETVTPKEQALLDLRDGVNLLGDVDLASLEDVENILSDLKDLKKEGRSFLSEKLQREKEERARIRLEANEEISKSMPFLFIKEGGIASATITVDTKKDGTLYVKSVTFFNEKGEVIKRQLGGEYIDGTFYNLRHKFQYAMEDPKATDFERQVMEQALQKSNAINGKDPITQEDIDRMEELRDIGILDEYEQAELEALESLMEAEQTVDVTNEALVPRNRDQLERNKTAISEDLKKLKVWSALKNWGKAYKGMDTPKKALEFFRNRLSTLETFCNILDRKGTWFRDNIYRPLNRMEETRLANTQNKESVFESIARSVGAKSIKKMQRDVSKKRIKLMIRGEQSVLNGDDMMRLIALSRNETQMEKLKAMGITQLEIDQMEGIVGSQAVDFVDAVVGYLSTEYYDQINNVYKSVYNINMPYIENYFPTETLTANPKGTDFILEGNFGKAFEADAASALKQRSDVTSDVKIETADGFFGTLSTHIESMERFKAYAEGTKKLQTAWKTKAVQTALAATNLNAVMGKTIALSINPQGMPATPSRVATWLQSKYTGYALAWKTIQILKQASSFIQAMPYFTVQPKLKVKVPGIDLLAFTVAHATTMLRLVSPMKTGPLANPVYKAAGISATFKERLKQGFRGELETLVSGIVEGRTRKPGWKKNRFRRGVKIAAGAPTVIGDILGVLGYMTVYEQNIRNGMSKEEALEKFNEYNATQQTRRGTERVGLQQPTGDAQEFKRVFAAFGSTLFLQLNKVAQTSKNISRAIRDGKLPKKSDINSLIINYAVANMLFVASANIMKLTRGTDEEKEEVYARMIEAMLGLTILFKMPFLGGAIESAYREWQGERPFGTTGVNPALSVYKDVSKAIKEKDALTGAKVAGELIMGMQFDVPTAAVKAMGGDYSQENVQDLMGLSTSYRVEEPEGYVVDYGKISDKELKKKNPELYKRKKQREKQREKARAPRERARKMRERSRKGR